MGLRTTGRAGVCFKPVEARRLRRAGARDRGAPGSDERRRRAPPIARTTDELGFAWVVLEDPDVEDLATTTHVVSQSLEERGFSERLLCAVFGFDGAARARWSSSTPTSAAPSTPSPRARGGARDTTLELRLQAVLGGELPIEPELERWYPVWEAPVSRG